MVGAFSQKVSSWHDLGKYFKNKKMTPLLYPFGLFPWIAVPPTIFIIILFIFFILTSTIASNLSFSLSIGWVKNPTSLFSFCPSHCIFYHPFLLGESHSTLISQTFHLLHLHLFHSINPIPIFDRPSQELFQWVVSKWLSKEAKYKARGSQTWENMSHILVCPPKIWDQAIETQVLMKSWREKWGG